MSSVQIMMNWGIGKVATNVLSMEQRKCKKSLYYLLLFKPIEVFNCLTNACRKRKPRKNTTKGWFAAEVSTSDRDTNTNEDVLTTINVTRYFN
jgi:hypothetical protein